MRRSLCHHQWWPTHRALGRPVTGPQGWKEAFGRSMLLVQWLSNMCPLVKAAALLPAVGVAREGGVSHGFLLGLSCVAACCVLHGSPSAIGETCLLLKEPCPLMPSVRSSSSLSCDKPQKKIMESSRKVSLKPHTPSLILFPYRFPTLRPQDTKIMPPTSLALKCY